ncbi:paraquat-inducible protein A [Methyloglobulus sp.]|uniref:paraquat-inducible protein A n=1 Tax=Methyloglobulus sp. TaxID=2518622 RepID=UPI0032B80F3D
MYEACPECDLLLNRPVPEPGDKAHCPRCGYLLQRPHKHSIERTLALSLAGLILMIPANLLPMIGINILGNSMDGNLWTGVSVLFNEDMWAVAILVLLSSVLLPFVNMGFAFLISFHLFIEKPNGHLVRWMRWLQYLNEWAMLEVYALGIIVACVKLAGMAELRFGFGLYAFIGLLFVNAMLANELDTYLFWHRIAHLGKK